MSSRLEWSVTLKAEGGLTVRDVLEFARRIEHLPGDTKVWAKAYDNQRDGEYVELTVKNAGKSEPVPF